MTQIEQIIAMIHDAETVSIKNQELQMKVRPGCCGEFEK